jgi:putative membrane protein
MNPRLAILAMALVAASCAHHRGLSSTQAPPPGAASDDEFLQFAAMQDHNVIDLSEAAVQRANDPKTRELARTLRADRGADLDRITRAARRRNTQLPTEADTRHADALARLRELPPAQFDREYLSLMVTDQEFILSTYQDRAQIAQVRAIRSAAADALPAIRRDLERTRSAAGSAMASNPK